MDEVSVCQSCGACCAHFRVAFDESSAAVPRDMTLFAGPRRRAMRGTTLPEDRRCIALSGIVGEDTACTIYGSRPVPCRDLQPAWSDGQDNPWCNEARIAHGLEPLSPGTEQV